MSLTVCKALNIKKMFCCFVVASSSYLLSHWLPYLAFDAAKKTELERDWTRLAWMACQ